MQERAGVPETYRELQMIYIHLITIHTTSDRVRVLNSMQEQSSGTQTQMREAEITLPFIHISINTRVSKSRISANKRVLLKLMTAKKNKESIGRVTLKVVYKNKAIQSGNSIDFPAKT